MDKKIKEGRLHCDETLVGHIFIFKSFQSPMFLNYLLQTVFQLCPKDLGFVSYILTTPKKGRSYLKCTCYGLPDLNSIQKNNFVQNVQKST